MKRFLLLALTAGLLSPVAAKAETWWLVIRYTGKYQTTIPTSSKAECNAALKKVLDRENWSGFMKDPDHKYISTICVKGK